MDSCQYYNTSVINEATRLSLSFHSTLNEISHQDEGVDFIETAYNKDNYLIIPLYGGLDMDSYVFLFSEIGTPPQLQSLIVDTGSTMIGFPCNNCENCGYHMGSPFILKNSETARIIKNRSQECVYETISKNNSNYCVYKQNFLEGSGVSGIFFEDVIRFPYSSNNALSMKYKYLGCHLEESSFFLNQVASGIVGFSPKFLNKKKSDTLLTSILMELEANPIFSLCMSETGGEMMFGHFTSSRHDYASNTINLIDLPLIRSQFENLQNLQYDINFKRKVKMIIKELTTKLYSEDISFIVDLLREINNFNENLDYPTFDEMLSNLLIKYISGLIKPDYHPMLPTLISLIRSQPSFTLTLPPPILWVPMISSSDYSIMINRMYFIGTDGKRYGSSSDSSCLLDSGATLSYIDNILFKSIVNQIEFLCFNNDLGNCYSRKIENNFCLTFDGCYINKIPSIYLNIKSFGTIVWDSSIFFKYYSKIDSYCLELASNNKNRCILGKSFMTHRNIIFDLNTYRIGITPAICPSNTYAFEPVNLPHKNTNDVIRTIFSFIGSAGNFYSKSFLDIFLVLALSNIFFLLIVFFIFKYIRRTS